MPAVDANTLISGALVFGYLVVATFFARFWTRTHDRLFVLFAVAFGLLAIQRLLLAVSDSATESTLLLYILRLLAFVVMLFAIIDKNRAQA